MAYCKMVRYASNKFILFLKSIFFSLIFYKCEREKEILEFHKTFSLFSSSFLHRQMKSIVILLNSAASEVLVVSKAEKVHDEGKIGRN